jgi:hypothetical protein
MTNRFEKPHILPTKINPNKIADLFSIASNMDSFEIKNKSLTDKIPLSVQDNNGNNLIHLTILNNGTNCELIRLQFIKFLYSENVNPDAPNRENITPLLYACERQYTTIVKYLIDIGVDINYVDNFNNNAYHYLFGSMIKNYNPIIKKSLFPRYKEINSKKIDLIKRIKKELFEKVLNQTTGAETNIAPELTSIIQTIENSIGTSVDAKNIVIDFQNEYNKLINDPKTQQSFSVNNLFSTLLDKFINLIQRKWNQFPKSGNINLHVETPNSYPLGDESGLSVIRNNDYKIYIKEECDRIISNLTDDILKDNEIVDLIDLDKVNNQLVTNFVQIVGADLTMASLAGHEDEYNDMNKFIHNNCIDNADNIIDYENNTFAGGSRQVEIIDEFNTGQITTLFAKTTEQIVGALAYSLIKPYNIGVRNAFDFNIQFNLFKPNADGPVSELKNELVQYIFNISNNNLSNIQKSEEKLVNIISRRFQMYKYLLELIEKRERFNPGHYLYVFCCAYKGIDRIINVPDNSNLKVELRQGIVLLCSAVYHNKGDILKSLYNVFKPLLIDNIITNRVNINSTYSNFIKLLLTDRKITDVPIQTNTNLDRIVILTDRYFNGEDIILKEDEKEDYKNYLNLNDSNLQGMDKSEKLGFYIVNYYSKMQNPPLLQNIVDILVLIRLYQIRGKQGDNSLDDAHFINRLRSLYLKPINFGNINNIQTDSNMEYTQLEDPNIDKYFKTLFNDRNTRKIYEQISQYQIPSRINYFLYGGYEYLNQPLDNERRLFLLKQIEANHFGLNFIGLIPSLNIIQNINLPPPKGGGPVLVKNTSLNLFNYNTNNNTGPDYNFFHTLPGNDYLNRPPTYLAYFNLLQTFSNNVNELQNRILSRLREMFNRLKSGNTELYSKAIGYYYPILNALESQEKFFNDISKNNSITGDNLPINTQQLTPYFPTNTFDINKFNTAVNRLNGLLFLYYYLNTQGDNKIKIPKFLYHQLGNKPLVIFDNPNKNISYPPNLISQDNTEDNTVTTDLDKLTGNYQSYNSGNDYDNIIKNIQNRRFFVSRDIIADEFITSKNSKLPPSLQSVFNDFLKYTINSLSRKAIDKIDDLNIQDEDIDKIPNLGNEMLNIQKKLLVAQYTEELIIDYLKNNVYRIGYKLFTNLIGNPVEMTETVEQLFGDLDFNVKLDKEPTLEEIEKININEKNIIKNYYNFSDKSIDKLIEQIKQQYKLYPNNYNSIRINKKFFRVDIKEEIVLLLLNNNCNLFTSNNEGQLSIINLLKHFKFDILDILGKNLEFDAFNTSNNLSPQKFIYNEYVMNLEKFISHSKKDNDKRYALQLMNFTQNQYNDVFNNIIGNEKLGFNIINNLKTSFAMCNYITQQFLSEKMYDFNNNYKYDDLNNILTLIEKQKIDFKNVYLNTILNTLNILKYNNDIVINDIIENYKNKNKILAEKLKILEDKKIQMKFADIDITNIDDDISKVEIKISSNEKYFEKISRIIDNSFLANITVNEFTPNIIKRYNKCIENLDYQRLVFMDAFKKMFNERKLNGSNENIIQHLLNIEHFNHENKTNLKDNILITQLSKFYSHLSGYCEVYFHNEYICHNGETINPIKEFVKDLLVFLTQNVICVGIETLVRKVLFEYFSLTEYSNMSLNNAKVDSLLNLSNFNDNNYNILAEKLVMNNTNIFQDEFEENEMMSESVNDLINNLLDSLINTQALKLDDKVKEQLKNITPYFETIVPKTINNWRVVIENQFLYVINHARILKCMNIVGLPKK